MTREKKHSLLDAPSVEAWIEDHPDRAGHPVDLAMAVRE